MNDADDDHRDPQVSRIYARASQGEPPPALDAAILAAARAAVAPAARPATRPWWRRLQAPLAVAATLVLAVALTLTIDRNPPPDAALPPATATPSSDADGAGARPPGTPALRSLEAGPANRAANERRKAAETPPEAARAVIAPPDAEAWIAEIRTLLRAGRNEEAAQRLREFRAAWPDHPLPADLRPPGQ